MAVVCCFPGLFLDWGITYITSVLYSRKKVKATYPSLAKFWPLCYWSIMHETLTRGCCQIIKKSSPCCSFFKSKIVHSKRTPGSPFVSWQKSSFVVSSVIGILINYSTSIQEVALWKNIPNCIHPAPNRRFLPVRSSNLSIYNETHREIGTKNDVSWHSR